MREIPERRSLRFLRLLLLSISLQFISGFADDLSSSNDKKAVVPNSGIGSKIAIICLALVAVSGILFLLFKLWQKKKREEQYVRLLKLFEEDDELELELGLRD